MFKKKFGALMAAACLCLAHDLRAQDSESTPAPDQPQATTVSGKEIIDNTKETLNSGKETISNAQSPDLGTGNFSSRTPFHVTVAVREGYDDNVYSTHSDKIGSFFTNGSAELDYKFGNQRTIFDFQLVGGVTYYYDRPFGQQYDTDNSLTINFEHHATPRLTFTLSGFVTYQSQPDFNNTLGINREVGNFFYSTDKFGVAYQWAPRFSTVTSYTLGVIEYDNSSIGSFENRFDHVFGNEFRFLVWPTTTLVGEYRYEIVDYDSSPFNSETHFVLGGFDHTFNPRFNVSLRAGAEFRNFDNFGEKTGPYAEATARYAANERTSVTFTARYGLEEPDVPESPSRKTFRTGLSISYALASRLTATGSVFYEHDENESLLGPTFFEPAFDEDSLNLNLGVRYDINHVFAILAGYSFTEVYSDIPLREYARNQVYLGLSATF